VNNLRNRERISGFGLFGVEFRRKKPGLSVHVGVGIHSHEMYIWIDVEFREIMVTSWFC